MECYYDIQRKERFQELFGDLDIGKNPTPSRNSYMVLRLNFSKVQVSEKISELERNFSGICNIALDSFVDRYRAHLTSNVSIDPTRPVSENLDALLDTVSRSKAPPVYLIVDDCDAWMREQHSPDRASPEGGPQDVGREYDNFSNQFLTSGRSDLYQNLTTGDSFFRTFFKVVKAGCESRAIGKVFITGVLPITMDDLTSGFNIAEIVALKSAFHGMLGFTQAEVDRYLEQVQQDYGIDTDQLEPTRELVRGWYNGYRFLSEAKESLYNATILTFFLKTWALERRYPQDMIDPNVKTDVSWTKRLGFGEDSPLQLTQTLLANNGIPYDTRTLSDKFPSTSLRAGNMVRFFEQDHYGASLFFLGMLSIKDDFFLGFPNQTLSSIFADYFSDLANVEVSNGYTEWFRAFLKDSDLGKLFEGFWTVYMGQIPAQAFDKINENFIRTAFFELCSRYISRHFSFGIEVNHPSGRSDWEMLGRPESEYRNRKWIVEFKHFPKSSGKSLEDITAPDPQDVAQAQGYKRDTLAQFPDYDVRTAVCVTVGNTGFRWFDLD